MASIVSSDDFTANALADKGVTVSRTPVTKTINTLGDELLTDGSPENISAIFNAKINKYTQTNLGLMQETTAYIEVGPSQAMVKDDKITYQSVTYRVLATITRGPSGSTGFYKFVELRRESATGNV